MRLSHELSGLLLVFVAVNLFLVVASIGLFARIGPAVELILERNDTTIASAEEVLLVLARRPEGLRTADDVARIEQALGVIRANVTEDEEPQVIEQTVERARALFAGDESARAGLIESLTSLIAINRRAMRAADLEAQRLGTVGAWVASSIGVLSLLLHLILGRRIERRLVRPLLEVRDVLSSALDDDPFRRCGALEAPDEIRHIGSSVNGLLDRSSAHERVDGGADA